MPNMRTPPVNALVDAVAKSDQEAVTSQTIPVNATTDNAKNKATAQSIVIAYSSADAARHINSSFPCKETEATVQGMVVVTASAKCKALLTPMSHTRPLPTKTLVGAAANANMRQLLAKSTLVDVN